MTPVRTTLAAVTIATAILALGLLTCPPALAAESGDSIVKKTDYAMTHARDQYFEYDLVTYEPGKDPRVLKFSVHLIGDKKRRLEFLAPGDVRGMRFLILDVDQMYVYMPAYKKVRRVASHVKSQGFMGSSYAQDEMSLTKFGEIFSPKLISENDETWTVEMTRKKGQTYAYPKLLVDIRKDIHQPVKVEYFNEKGQMAKHEVREGWRCEDNMCNPRKMTMIDHTRGDLKSIMVQRAWKPNTGISEREFTVRALQRRR